MDSGKAIDNLKGVLRKEVARFYRRDEAQWKSPIVETLRELKDVGVDAVFFGGTLRSLLVARVCKNRLGRPRDVDIVVAGSSIESLSLQFEKIISRKTRFGGLQLRRKEWQFDIWPLHQTWAFVNDQSAHRQFANLPDTTFFNLEAIAVDVWSRPGKSRRIYSGDDQFFDGILRRTLEVNREHNPFPDLCVLRGLVLASSLDFAIGPRLVNYIAEHGTKLTVDDLEELQHRHYGHRRVFGETLKDWVNFIAKAAESRTEGSISLPIARQQEMWSLHESHTRITFHVKKQMNLT